MPAETDYYTGTESMPSADEASPAPEAPPEEEGETLSALLPKSLVGDVRPGDTITLTVDHIYEDEVEVSLAEGEPESPTDMENAEAELEAMASRAPIGMGGGMEE